MDGITLELASIQTPTWIWQLDDAVLLGPGEPHAARWLHLEHGEEVGEEAHHLELDRAGKKVTH